MSGNGDARGDRPGDGLDLEQVSEKLAELTEASAVANQAMARAAQLAGELADCRLVERVEGLLLEQVLMCARACPLGTPGSW
jgi:hypothetical protein